MSKVFIKQTSNFANFKVGGRNVMYVDGNTLWTAEGYEHLWMSGVNWILNTIGEIKDDSITPAALALAKAAHDAGFIKLEIHPKIKYEEEYDAAYRTEGIWSVEEEDEWPGKPEGRGYAFFIRDVE